MNIWVLAFRGRSKVGASKRLGFAFVSAIRVEALVWGAVVFAWKGCDEQAAAILPLGLVYDLG